MPPISIELQTPREIPTTPVSVTFFEDRAEVKRRASVSLQAGVNVLHLSGISPVVDDPSVSAGIDREGIRVVSAKVLRRVQNEPTLGKEDLVQAEAAHRDAQARTKAAERAAARARAQAERLVALSDRFVTGLVKVPRSKGGAQASEWREAYLGIEESHRGTLDEIAACNEELIRAKEEEARLAARLALGRRLNPRQETLIEVQILVAPSVRVNKGTVDLDLSYRLPSALWRPEHLARLFSTADGDRIEILTYATAWQHTGETWHNIESRFSTARPAQSASPPLLTDDLLFSRKKSDAERRTVVVEAREQAIAVTGAASAVRAVDEMPGVDDGGEPIWFAPERPATILSDGEPVRLQVGQVILPCQVELVAYPEKSTAVFVRATATHTGPGPILAGPVRLIRGGEMVGLSRIDFVPRGEGFEIGFGIDDGLRVRRQIEEQRDTSVFGAQKITRTVRVFVSNLSAAPRQAQITERVPVSEIEDLKVSVLKTQGAPVTQDDRDGFLRFQLRLAGNAHQELVLTYRLEASSKVQLP